MKLLTWASHRVYGQEARHRLCNATVLSRFARESFETKAHYSQRYHASFGEIVVEPEEEDDEEEQEEEAEQKEGDEEEKDDEEEEQEESDNEGNYI